MRDFLPDDVRRREHVIGVITRVYESYGFEPLETPAVENIETLLGKYGEEGNQLIFKILKRGEHEASGQADLALRYDLTVPLARVVAQYQSKLPRFFKRYQRAAGSASSISATWTRWVPRHPWLRPNSARRCRMRCWNLDSTTSEFASTIANSWQVCW
jgi:Histidyl-tRNA synthetase